MAVPTSLDGLGVSPEGVTAASGRPDDGAASPLATSGGEAPLPPETPPRTSGAPAPANGLCGVPLVAGVDHCPDRSTGRVDSGDELGVASSWRANVQTSANTRIPTHTPRPNQAARWGIGVRPADRLGLDEVPVVDQVRWAVGPVAVELGVVAHDPSSLTVTSTPCQPRTSSSQAFSADSHVTCESSSITTPVSPSSRARTILSTSSRG